MTRLEGAYKHVFLPLFAAFASANAWMVRREGRRRRRGGKEGWRESEWPKNSTEGCEGLTAFLFISGTVLSATWVRSCLRQPELCMAAMLAVSSRQRARTCTACV